MTNPPQHRSTGCTRFIANDATVDDLLASIQRQVQHLEDYAGLVTQHLDLGAVTVTTRRIPDGRVAVRVTADLAEPRT